MKRAALVIWILLYSATSLRGAGPFDPRLFAGKGPGETASVLVVMREQADLSAAEMIADPAERRRFVFEALRSQAELSQRAVREQLDAAGASYRAFYLVNMIEVQADRTLAGELARRADVFSVAANREAPLGRAPTLQESEITIGPAPTAVEPNVTKIRAPEIWSRGFTGQGIVVGNADTGIAWDHPALSSHYRGWNGASTASHDYNWHDAIHDARPGNSCGSDSPGSLRRRRARHVHGGLAVGDDGARQPGRRGAGRALIGCRNMDRGDGTPARYTECFEFFLAPTDRNGENPRPDLGANVINNSWGCPAERGVHRPETSLQAVVENMRAAGILVVGRGLQRRPRLRRRLRRAVVTTKPPSSSERRRSRIRSPASRAAGPPRPTVRTAEAGHLSRRGSALRVGRAGRRYSGGFSGTSGATPMVAGAVALLWSARAGPQGPADRVRRDLLRARPSDDVVSGLRRLLGRRRSQRRVRVGAHRRRCRR